MAKYIDKEGTGYLTKKQIKLLKKQYGGYLGYNYPKEMNNLSTWDLSSADLRYPTSIKLAVEHLLEMDSERRALKGASSCRRNYETMNFKDFGGKSIIHLLGGEILKHAQ